MDSGWHKLRLRLTTPAPPQPNGCPNDSIWDQVYIPFQLKAVSREDTNCLNVPKRIVMQAHGGQPYGLVNYAYTFFAGNMSSNTQIKPMPANPNSQDSTIVLNPPGAGLSTYKVVVKDLNGCKDSTLLTLKTLPLPTRELPPIVRVCPDVDTM